MQKAAGVGAGVAGIGASAKVGGEVTVSTAKTTQEKDKFQKIVNVERVCPRFG